jgi:hypothetical protein
MSKLFNRAYNTFWLVWRCFFNADCVFSVDEIQITVLSITAEGKGVIYPRSECGSGSKTIVRSTHTKLLSCWRLSVLSLSSYSVPGLNMAKRGQSVDWFACPVLWCFNCKHRALIIWEDVYNRQVCRRKYFEGILVGYFKAPSSHSSEETEEVHKEPQSQHRVIRPKLDLSSILSRKISFLFAMSPGRLWDSPNLECVELYLHVFMAPYYFNNIAHVWWAPCE